MTHLNITQGLYVESVTPKIIYSLYNRALSIAEPEQGETDNMYLKGNLSTTRAYNSQIQYLTTRFPDLNITAANYYQEFVDSNLKSALVAAYGDGIGILLSDVANISISKDNISGVASLVTSFPEFKYFTASLGSGGYTNRFENFVNMTSIDLTEMTYLRLCDFKGSGITTVNAPNLIGFSSYGQYAFHNCTNLTTVLSLGSITTIPKGCFKNCTSLYAFNGLGSFTSIGAEAFLGCSSLEINNPTLNATSIGGDAFNNSGLKGTLNCPNLTSIGNSGFYNTKLTTVECLGYITEIKDSSFRSCTDLTTVYIPYECTLIKVSAFSGCTNLATIKQYNKSLSDYAEGETPVFNDLSRVTYYGSECFAGTSITGITNSVILNATYIDNRVFAGKYSDTTLNLLYVTSIGTEAFKDNSSIISVTIGDVNNKTCTKVGTYGCFQNCTNLQSFDIENTSVTSLGLQTVTGGNLTTVKLPTTLTTYGVSGYPAPLSFKLGANVTITGLDGVSTVNGYISGCTVLNAIYMPSYISGYNSIIKYKDDFRTYNTTIKQLYYPSFKYCTFESFTANQSVIFNNTFFAYRLRENDSTWVRVNTLYFKDLENIQPYMFYGCLPKNLVINNVTPPTIGTMPTCPASLLAVYTYPTWSTTLFGTIPTTGNDAMTIYVPDSAVSTYQANSYYSSYTILGISNLTKYATEALWEAAGRPDDCLIEEYMS